MKISLLNQKLLRNKESNDVFIADIYNHFDFDISLPGGGSGHAGSGNEMLRNVLSGFRYMLSARSHKGVFLLLSCLFLLLMLVSCTEYERQGVNSRPFNEPAGWENNPYGNAFRN